MSKIIKTVSNWFCREFHTRYTRPVHGHYRCLQCMKVYRSPFD